MHYINKCSKMMQMMAQNERRREGEIKTFTRGLPVESRHSVLDPLTRFATVHSLFQQSQYRESVLMRKITGFRVG